MPVPADPAPHLVAEPRDRIDRIPEAAIQDAWVRGLFTPDALTTTDGQPVHLLDRGRLNRDSGPDVTDVRVQIGPVVWAGDVEVHRTSGQWGIHGHDRDSRYNRVVLHVVLAADRATGTLRREDGSVLPELVLLPHLHRSLRGLLHDFYVEPRSAPHCAPRWREVAPEVQRPWVRALGRDRQQQRVAALGAAFGTRPDLDRLLVTRVFRALGYEPNAAPMTALAERLPLATARRLGDASAIRDVLLALSGLAPDGLFDQPGHAAAVDWLARHDVRSLSRDAWRRGGRPANAPVRRLGQAAPLLAPGGILHHDPVAACADRLQQSTAAALAAFRTGTGPQRIGAQRARTILVDAVLPVLGLFADLTDRPGLHETVLRALGDLPAHDDRTVRRFEAAGFPAQSALESQGLHRLAGAFCDEGRCARCAIGRALYPALGVLPL